MITWLVRKPGAFRGDIHRDGMFPGVVFRHACDRLRAADDRSADARHPQLPGLAAHRGKTVAADPIGATLRSGEVPRLIKTSLESERRAFSGLPPSETFARFDEA